MVRNPWDNITEQANVGKVRRKYTAYKIKRYTLWEICQKVKTGIPHFSKACFYERPTVIVPVFTNQKKFKEDFRFHKERHKVQTVVSMCAAGSGYGGGRHPTRPVRPCWAASQRLHSASQHQATRALSCIHEHLCFILIYFVHLLERCSLRYQKSLREVILGSGNAQKFFHII